MTAKLSERLTRYAILLSDTSSLKSELPVWLIDEIGTAAELMIEAAELARRVESADFVTVRDHEGAMPGDRVYAGKLVPTSWIGQRIALVPVD